MPVVDTVLEGTYGNGRHRNNNTSSSLARNVAAIPNIHVDAFRTCPSHINRRYQQYWELQRAWDWVTRMETGVTSGGTRTKAVRTHTTTLANDDYNLLCRLFSLDTTPNDVLDAILNYLTIHDFVLRYFPREVVRAIIEFFVLCPLNEFISSQTQ